MLYILCALLLLVNFSLVEENNTFLSFPNNRLYQNITSGSSTKNSQLLKNSYIFKIRFIFILGIPIKAVNVRTELM